MSLIDYTLRKLSKESWQFEEIIEDLLNNPDSWIFDNQSEIGSFKLYILQKDVAVKEDYIEIWLQDNPRIVGLRNCPSYKGLKTGKNFNAKEEYLLKEAIKKFNRIIPFDRYRDNIRRMKLRERLSQNLKDIQRLNDSSRLDFDNRKNQNL